MNSSSVSFIKVTTNEIIEFISSAKERIIFVKPAFFKKEIESIFQGSKQNDPLVTIYMESGDSAIRYGFGETDALELLNEKLGKIEVHIANRIRVAILIVDDRAIVYMPNLTFIEEESKELTFPNGFLCNKEVIEDIVKQFVPNQTANKKIEKLDNVVILPGGHIPLLDSNVVANDIIKSIENLKKNPAVDPAKLNKVNFYRNNYKILKMQIWGVRINNKSINIKPFYSLLPEINKRLKSSWNIFTLEDINKLQNTKLFEVELSKIKEEYKDYLFDAGRFGSIININKKEEYIKSINKLKDDFKNYLGKEPSDEVRNRFEMNITNKESQVKKINLEEILQESKKQLEQHLLKLCPKDDEFLEKVFRDYRHLRKELKNNQKSVDEVLKEFVTLFVSNKLKFIDAEEIIEKIDIKFDWYDISDELLFDNDDFKEIIKQYNLEFRENLIGYK